jgi:hypothetical protein
MGRGIPFDVAEFLAIRSNRIQGELHILGHMGIRIFVHRQRGSGMGDKDHADPFGKSRSSYKALNLPCDRDPFVLPGTAEGKTG